MEKKQIHKSFFQDKYSISSKVPFFLVFHLLLKARRFWGAWEGKDLSVLRKEGNLLITPERKGEVWKEKHGIIINFFSLQ